MVFRRAVILLNVILLLIIGWPAMSMSRYSGKTDSVQQSDKTSTPETANSKYIVIDHPGEETASETGVSERFDSLVTSFGNILSVVLGICALISLVSAVFTLMQGDQSSAKRMFLWLIGFVVGLILVSIFKDNPLSKSGVSSAGGFSSVAGEIKAIIQILLSVVAMISAAVSAFHMMKGEREGVEKVLRVLVISCVGFIIIGVF